MKINSNREESYLPSPWVVTTIFALTFFALNLWKSNLIMLQGKSEQSVDNLIPLIFGEISYPIIGHWMLVDMKPSN